MTKNTKKIIPKIICTTILEISTQHDMITANRDLRKRERQIQIYRETETPPQRKGTLNFLCSD